MLVPVREATMNGTGRTFDGVSCINSKTGFDWCSAMIRKGT